VLLAGLGAAAGDPRPGLLALHQRLAERGRRAYEAAHDEWLGGRAAGFFERIGEVAANLAALAGDDRELERKYLLRGLPRFDAPPEIEEIEQGYLPGERVVERLRRVRTDGAERYVRTVKSGTGGSRIELEEPIEGEMFERLWPLTAGRRVRKRRYRLRDGAHAWDVDEYLDRELVVAEVELAVEDEEVRPPPWLQPVLLREITDEPSFSNRELAR
jgi:CYTH domain-containing protein